MENIKNIIKVLERIEKELDVRYISYKEYRIKRQKIIAEYEKIKRRLVNMEQKQTQDTLSGEEYTANKIRKEVLENSVKKV